MSQKLPKHVAIVMDGNGRWAEHLNLPRVEGHRKGVEVVNDVVRCCLEKKISILSLFAFSCENWARPSEEVEFLMQLFIHVIERELQQLNEHGVCLRFIGDRTRLSMILQDKMDHAEKLTQNNDKLILNIAVNYSGKWDIVQASKSALHRILSGELSLDDLNENELERGLSTYHLQDPDLMIRTSGEQRISNFFLWQAAYTELYFTDVKWPDFTTDDFKRALEIYRQRERRYGLTSVQLCRIDRE